MRLGGNERAGAEAEDEDEVHTPGWPGSERHVPGPESGRERTRSRSRNWNPTRERDAHVQNDLGPTRAGERENIEKGESQRVCSREARPSGIHIARGPPARNRFLLHMPSMIICCSTCGPSRSHPPSAKGVHMAIVLRQKRAHPQAARVLHAASPASSACPLPASAAAADHPARAPDSEHARQPLAASH